MKVHQNYVSSGESPLHIVVSASTPSSLASDVSSLSYPGATNSLLEQKIGLAPPMKAEGYNSVSITPLPIYNGLAEEDEEYLTLGEMIDEQWVDEDGDAAGDKSADYDAIMKGEYAGSLDADLALYVGQDGTEEDGNCSALELSPALSYLLDLEEMDSDTPTPYALRTEDTSSYYAFETTSADSTGDFEGDEPATPLKTATAKAETDEAEEASDQKEGYGRREGAQSLDQMILRAT